MDRLNELQFILEKLATIHRTLLGVLDEEYAHMVQLDIPALGEAAHAKEVLLSEIWDLEQLRQKTVQELAAQHGLDPEKTTLKEISENISKQVSGETVTKLSSIREVLQLLVEQAKELNQRNMTFANDSLARIEELKRNVLGLTSPSSKENYSNQGTRQPNAEQGGRLLSTEA